MNSLPIASRWMKRMLVVFALLACLPPAALFSQDEAKSPPEALVIYSDAANFQNNKAYELATDEWEKFIKRFPNDPLLPKATYYAGVCYLQLKNFEKAAGKFGDVVDNEKWKDFELRQDALLNLGWCQYSLASGGKPELYNKSAESFGTLVKEFPDGKYIDQALWFQGESLYRTGKKEESLAPYKALVENHPKSSLRTDAVYALGVTHEELGQYADAGKVYDIFLEEFKDSDLFTEVRMRKAETLLQGDKLEEAAKIFGEVASVEGFTSADYALMRQGLCLAKQGKFAEAAAIYAKIATDYPKSSYKDDATVEAGRAFYRAEDYENSATWFTKVLDAAGVNAPEAAHWLCRIHLRNKEPKKAAELAASMIPKAADNQYLVNLKMDQAEGLLESGDAGGALPIFLSVSTDHADHALAADALYNAAFAALETKDFDAAATHAAAFLEKHQGHRFVPDVKYIAAESLLLKKEYAAAEAKFRELVENHADHSDIKAWQLRIALASFLQKKYGDTIDFLSPLLADFSVAARVAEANYLVGVSHFYLENFGETETKLKAALAADPKWRQADETLLFLGQAQRRLDQLDPAEKTIRKLIADFPQSALLDQANYRLGEILYAANKFEDAAASYHKVVADSPKSNYVPYSYYGEGWSRLKLKQNPQAIESFTALIDGFPNHTLVPDTLFARAICNRLDGNYKAAIDDATKYLASGEDLPHELEALYEKGQAEVGLKRFDDAAKTFAAILASEKTHPTPDRVIYELAWAHKELGNDKEAVTNFAKLTKDYPESDLAAEAHFHVGEGSYNDAKFSAAQGEYASAKAKAKQGKLKEKITYKLGWSHYQQKAYDKALAEFSEQVEGYPDGDLFGEGVFMKAECLYRTEDYEEALPAYKKALEVLADSPKATETVKVLIALHGGQSAGQLKKWDESLAMLTPIAETFPESPYVPEAIYEQGWAQQNLGKTGEALKLYEQAAEKSRGAVGARARFMAGEIHFLNKDFDEAVKEFQRVMFGYGGDDALADVKPWQAKAASEAGRVTETAISAAQGAEKAAILSKAKQFYMYVVEKHPQSEVAPLAKKRLTELNKL